MDAFEDQIILTPKENETAADSSPKIDHPELKALLAVKKFTAQLEEEYNELLKIESELDELHKNGLLIIEAAASPEAIAQWNAISLEMKKAISGINDVLTKAKENTTQKEKSNSQGLWELLTIHVTALEDNAANNALTLLPEAVHLQWEKEFEQLETPLVESSFHGRSHARYCCN